MEGTPPRAHGRRRRPRRRAPLVAGTLLATGLLAVVGIAVAQADTPGAHAAPATAPAPAGQPAARTDPAAPAPLAPALGQTVELDVLPGSLWVAPSDVQVGLVPVADGSRLLGKVVVDVVDARGSLEGWHLRTRVAGVADQRGHPIADAQVRVAADHVDVRAGSPTDRVVTGSVRDDAGVVATATPGGGGGTFGVRVRVVVDLPDGVRATGGRVSLVFGAD